MAAAKTLEFFDQSPLYTMEESESSTIKVCPDRSVSFAAVMTKKSKLTFEKVKKLTL